MCRIIIMTKGKTMNKSILTLVFVLTLPMVGYGRDNASAGEIRLLNAIYRAEGGAKTSHPYGILAHYKKTTPRQACLNTIRHAKRDWNGKGDFVEFLGRRYCPVGAKNDPTGLNKNWIKNVKKLLKLS